MIKKILTLSSCCFFLSGISCFAMYNEQPKYYTLPKPKQLEITRLIKSFLMAKQLLQTDKSVGEIIINGDTYKKNPEDLKKLKKKIKNVIKEYFY